MEVRRQLHVKASPSYHFLFHLQALGVAVDLGPQSVARCVREAGVGFIASWTCVSDLFSSSVHVSPPGAERGGVFGTPIGGASRNGSQASASCESFSKFSLLFFHLQALGVAVDLGLQSVARCVREAGVGSTASWT